MDPVGKWGEGVRQVYSRLGDAGVSPLDILMYEDARHEVFSEINREEFFSDLKKWLFAVISEKEGADGSDEERKNA